MAGEVFCQKHGVKPSDDKWKVVLEELTGSDGENPEPFSGQVCPLCYLHLRERMRELKRNLKIESREAVSLRASNDRLQMLVDAVIATVKQLTGKDAVELASREFTSPLARGCPASFVAQRGDLLNILPNLIVEAANGKK